MNLNPQQRPVLQMQIAQSKMVKNFLYPFPRGPATFHPIMVLGLGHMHKQEHEQSKNWFGFMFPLGWCLQLRFLETDWDGKLPADSLLGGLGGLSALGIQGREDRRTGQREKPANGQQSGGSRDSGNLMGSSKTGWACRSCPTLREGARPFNPLSTHYIPWGRQFFVVRSNSHWGTMLWARSSPCPQQLGMHQFSRGI